MPLNEDRLSWSAENACRPASAPLLFLRSLLNNPLGIGALAPSSPRLSRLMASSVNASNSLVLEVGGGTGSVTRALLETGLAPERLVVIERDPYLAAYLRREFPGVRIRCADALNAARIASGEFGAHVETVISSLPLRNMNKNEQVETVQAMLDALHKDGQFIQFTYAAGCPVPREQFGLRAECLGRVWANLPPAAVWRFTSEQNAGRRLRV